MIDGPRQLVIYRVNHGIPRFTLSSFFLISFFPPQSLNGLLATIYIEQSRPRLNLLPRFDLSFLLFLYFILPTNEIANSHRILTSSSTSFLFLSLRDIFFISLSLALFSSLFHLYVASVIRVVYFLFPRVEIEKETEKGNGGVKEDICCQ